MTRFAEDDLTCDAFLGGKLHLWQPRRGRGYRAGVDPVLLAASIEATAGQSVLELGCGVGAAVRELIIDFGSSRPYSSSITSCPWWW